jgi:hypothetical protein
VNVDGHGSTMALFDFGGEMQQSRQTRPKESAFDGHISQVDCSKRGCRFHRAK